MKKFVLGVLLPLVLSACAATPPTTHPGRITAAPGWEIGPIIKGENKSPGMPLNPERETVDVPRLTDGEYQSWGFDIPVSTYPPTSHVHYVTANYGPLTGKTKIYMKFKVTIPPGASIHPRTARDGPSMITLYFQQAGDDWSGAAKYETYRWYATFSTIMPITDGVHEIVAPLDGNWTAVFMSSRETEPERFKEAIDHTEKVGFVLGGGDGYGHGIYAEGAPVHFTVLDFRIE